MRRNSAFTAVAVLSLALGVGANTAIFSLFYTVMLRPLPVSHPNQLTQLLVTTPDQIRNDGYFGWDKYEYIRDHNCSFSAMTGMSFDNLAAIHTDGSDPETLVLESVPGNYFGVLGLKPAAGRLPGPQDTPASGDSEVVVVSWRYWQTRLHADPSVAGKSIWYGDVRKTIAGVAPREYTGPRVGARTDVWMPAASFNLHIVGRLKPGVTLRQAEAEVNVLYQSWYEESGTRAKTGKPLQAKCELESAGAGLVRIRDRYGKALVLLMAVVGLLLLLACINLASLLLSRSAGRQRELAVRVGLGASRWQLIRQMLTESLLLSGAGTLAGIAVAYFGSGVLVRIMAGGRAFERVAIEVKPDPALLLFTAAIAMTTGLLFGLAPAWYAFRAFPAPALRQSGRGGDTWFWSLFGKGLVGAQVALSVFLATASVIFLSHFTRLRSFDLGFRSDHVLLVTLDPGRGYAAPELPARYRELLMRMDAIPQVRSASVSGCTPLQGCGSGSRFMIAEGHTEAPEQRKRTVVVFASPRYFETLGIPLIGGREFRFEDAGGPRVAVVNQAMARYYFPGENPIGKHVTVDRSSKSGRWFGTDEPYEIVGLVGDAKAVELRDAPYPTMYFNMFQENRLNHQFELRTRGDPMAVADTVRSLIREVAKDVPVKSVTTLADQVDSNIVPEHLVSTLSEFFGWLGAILAGVGLYGLLAYTVARRIHEIGIRMALGATAGMVSRLVIRDAMAMVGGGLATGLALVLWGKPLALSVLHDLKWDPVMPLVVGSAAIVVVALAASYVPARRASRVDPMTALRHE
jgi:predicted permease